MVKVSGTPLSIIDQYWVQWASPPSCMSRASSPSSMVVSSEWAFAKPAYISSVDICKILPHYKSWISMNTAHNVMYVNTFQCLIKNWHKSCKWKRSGCKFVSSQNDPHDERSFEPYGGVMISMWWPYPLTCIVHSEMTANCPDNMSVLSLTHIADTWKSLFCIAFIPAIVAGHDQDNSAAMQLILLENIKHSFRDHIGLYHNRYSLL